MPAGDVRQGKFTKNFSGGTQSIAGLIGGTTYAHLRIQAHTEMLIGNSTIDPTSGTLTHQGYRMSPGEVMTLENHTATAGIIDGAKIVVRGIRDSPPASFTVFAIDNV